MYRHLPNLLTVLRLFLAAVFLVTLSHYRYGTDTRPLLLASIVLFALAGITDYLDGYLARRWQVETTFGRIMDPFCDKVLVLAAFIFLAGPRFVNPDKIDQIDERIFWAMIPGNTVSGVYPWMVVVMLARELLVTGIRGEMERLGVEFGAKLAGKAKTVLQLVTVPAVMTIVWLDPDTPGYGWMAVVRNGLVYLTVIVTVISGVPYITGAARVMRLNVPERRTDDE